MSLFCCTLGTGAGKVGEHRPSVGRRVETELQCHREGVAAVLWFFVPPHWSAGRGGLGWARWPAGGARGEALGGHSPTSLASVWLSRGRIV